MTAETKVPPTPSFGEERVRLGFNPGSHDLVTEIKRAAAALIDLCDKHTRDPAPRRTVSGVGPVDDAHAAAERNRCWSLAMTHFEDGAMWAVKAATTGK